MFSLQTVFLISLIVVLILFDVIHALRMIFIIFLSHKNNRRSTKSILDTGVIRKICLPMDLDIFMHMNNGTYLKHCDIARIQLWYENGVWEKVFRSGGSMVLGGSCNRYRRAITLFTKYTIYTKVIYWDDAAFYLEQTFVRDSDGFVCFIALIKQTVLGVSPESIVSELYGDSQTVRPESLPELKLWIESTKCSSERLRK